MIRPALVLICCQLHSAARGLVAPPAVRSELSRAAVRSSSACSAAARGSRLSAARCSTALLAAPARGRPVLMKAPHRGFRLSDWYGQDWDHKKPFGDTWVSPWAKAHYKLRQQEIEIEQCEFMLQHAVENEDYEEADGLKTRVERLRSQHPIIPREERLAEALREGNFALANVFRNDLERVKASLGLPKYTVGQVVEPNPNPNPNPSPSPSPDPNPSPSPDQVRRAQARARQAALGRGGEADTRHQGASG